MFEVRPGRAEDLEAVAAVQAGSPEAARWHIRDYLGYDLLVAAAEGKVFGFLAARRTGPGESEILNLAVQPEWRRRGAARALLRTWTAACPGAVFLEVRESNTAARNFYQVFGFHEVARRKEYYENPPDTAIVLKFHSC